MTTEERFEKIERSLVILVETHERNQEPLSQLMRVVDSHFTSSSARIARIEGALAANVEQTGQLREIIARFEQNADSRMRRIEDNLDILIRAISAEHSNGKAKS